MIPIFQPNIDQRDIDAVTEVLQSKWLGMGAKTNEFEKNFANYLGANYAVALNSCTSALDLALKLANIKEDDEVIVPVISFASTAHAVLYNRAKLVFADIDTKTLHLNLDELSTLITEKTKAIIPVHYSGRPVDFDKLEEIIGDRDITLIEDAAHSVGASYKNKKCGILGDLAAFSFHAVKPLSIGDGGAITTSDEYIALRAKKLSWLGINKSTWDRIGKKQYSWEYEIDEIGYKYHMNDIQAALALVQLKKLDEGIQERKVRASFYHSLLSEIDEVRCPLLDDKDFKSAWHIFCVRCEQRDKLNEYMLQNGISTGVHYKPLHLFKCYNNTQVFPIAEEAFKYILSLPLYSTLEYNQITSIVKKIKDFYAKN